MNKTVVVAIVVIAAIVVGVPLAAKVMQSSESSSESGDTAPSADAAAPAPTLPPALDANSLTNTQWSIKVDKISLTVTFLPNGVLQAQSPMLKIVAGTDTVGGTWTVDGANLNITATAGDKSVSETGIISGDQIIIKGSPAKRLR
jgi:cytoskeletal protein RodZ